MSSPPAQGRRLPFCCLPPDLRLAVEAVCGGRIEQVEDCPAGFSPGVAARLTTGTGRFFVKAVSAEANAGSPALHRREGHVLAALAGTAVQAPGLYAAVDEEPWMVLVTELLPGRNPAVPWERADVDTLVRCLNALAVAGTPARRPCRRWRS